MQPTEGSVSTTFTGPALTVHTAQETLSCPGLIKISVYHFYDFIHEDRGMVCFLFSRFPVRPIALLGSTSDPISLGIVFNCCNDHSQTDKTWLFLGLAILFTKRFALDTWAWTHVFFYLKRNRQTNANIHEVKKISPVIQTQTILLSCSQTYTSLAGYTIQALKVSIENGVTAHKQLLTKQMIIFRLHYCFPD